MLSNHLNIGKERKWMTMYKIGKLRTSKKKEKVIIIIVSYNTDPFQSSKKIITPQMFQRPHPPQKNNPLLHPAQPA